MKLDDLHKATFEYYRNSYLTFEQTWEAKDWMKKHLLHVFNLIKDLDKGFPPTEFDDLNDPRLWKGGHWYWFVNEYIKK